jgi:ABC-type transporter Mla maintaining outer membrane lipid asymmetry permease subunit MlaE
MGRGFLAWAGRRVDRWGFLGRTFILGAQSLSGPRNRRLLVWARCRDEALLCFRNALFLSSATGLMAGFMWAVVWFGALDNLGGTETLVRLALTVQLNEVSPFLVASVVLTSYTSPAAARIARVRVSGALDTLRLMGVPPAHLLIWPRFLGQLAAFPSLLVVHCAYTVMGVALGARILASYPLADFLDALVSGARAYSFFRMAVQSVLMSCALSFFALHYPYRGPAGPESEIPDLVRRGNLEAIFWACVSGILVSVLYA